VSRKPAAKPCPFDKPLSMTDGERVTYKDFVFQIEYPRDDTLGPPWKEYDSHGVVSEWTGRTKRPGERVLASDRQSWRFYDIEASLALAAKDGWGTRDGRQPGERLKAYRARAVEEDFRYLKAWCDDEWWWIGVQVKRMEWRNADRKIAHLVSTPDQASLWGIESNCGTDYLTEVVVDLCNGILEERTEPCPHCDGTGRVEAKKAEKESE
jgi:hypothetical protein